MCVEKRTDGFRPMKPEFSTCDAPTPRGAAQCSVAMCCDVLPCMRAVLWWISVPDLLFVFLVHVCGVTHCSLCAFVQCRLHMGDVVVDESEWWKLNDEFYDIREDAGKVNSFMVKYVNKKWKV